MRKVEYLDGPVSLSSNILQVEGASEGLKETKAKMRDVSDHHGGLYLIVTQHLHGQ